MLEADRTSEMLLDENITHDASLGGEERKKAVLFVAILEEEEDQGTGTGEGRGTLSSEIPVDMMVANARTPKEPRTDATADKTEGVCQSGGAPTR
jgi:hypothetical protein